MRILARLHRLMKTGMERILWAQWWRQNNALVLISECSESKIYAVRVFGRTLLGKHVCCRRAMDDDPDNNPATLDTPQIINNSWGQSGWGSHHPCFREMVLNWPLVGINSGFFRGEF